MNWGSPQPQPKNLPNHSISNIRQKAAFSGIVDFMHVLNTEASHKRYSLFETKKGMPCTACARKTELKPKAKEPLLQITHFKRVHLNFYGAFLLCNVSM